MKQILIMILNELRAINHKLTKKNQQNDKPQKYAIKIDCNNMVDFTRTVRAINEVAESQKAGC